MREASVDILATFVGRSISVGKYVVQYKLWDCRMEHVVITGGKKRSDVDYKLVLFLVYIKHRTYDLVRLGFWSKAVLQSGFVSLNAKSMFWEFGN